jgi:hypothetical protein
MRDSLASTLVVLAPLLLVSACATLVPRVEGRNEIVAWQATDMALAPETVNDRTQWYYTFELIVRELRGTAVTFNEIETTIYQPGTTSWTGRYRGTWRLDANDQFRIPLVSTLSCHPTGGGMCTGTMVPIPLWRIHMTGTDERGQPAGVVIDLTLPADPPSSPAGAAKAIRSITLVPPRSGQAPAR